MSSRIRSQCVAICSIPHLVIALLVLDQGDFKNADSLLCLMVLLLCLWAGHQGQTRQPASVTIRHAVRTPSMQPSNTVILVIRDMIS